MTLFEEKTIATEKIFEGKVIDLQVDTVKLPNGHESKRELVKHPGAVAVIAVTDEDKLVLVKQFRKPLEKTILEIPAGKIDPGEEPIKTAARELREETGYTAEGLSLVTSFYTSPGFADEIIYLYEATGLIKGDAQPDDDEFVEIEEVDLNVAATYMADQTIHDAKTAYAVMYLQLKQARNQS
ncbi:NUDIX hydrolase [Alkalicoccobacillus murimartini]|uniref:ADP-ribose pyrophosphatase n=1 Tax=Alkalicoccobacillus murimartini TaxID=171685 RepID=A0ABT9YFB6_9BACI|nr:NUDIX hydrolase [Alkalicoccobacillus murimartini]MDQ0205769.1 ADP-ribose pyrophosphatase [Alkalicoccobacillus murimartini]